MKPLISVIIPSRRDEEILTNLSNQTYDNIEVITEIDEKCEGQSVVRNRGAKKAKGKFLFFCDNDIVLQPDCLMNLYNALKENKQAMWAFGRFKIDNAEFNFFKPIAPPEDVNSREFVEYFHGVSTMSLIRAEAKPVFDEALRRFEDWDLWVRLTKDGKMPVFVDKYLFQTTFRPQGVSSQSDDAKWQRRLYKKHIKPLADIIIPHHDQHALLAKCLERIDNSIFNIIVVSGGTFAENCNKGAKLAETDNLIFLNDDTLPEELSLTKLAKDESDITGCAQYIPLRHKKFYGIKLRDYPTIELAESFDDTDIPSGFCFKVKKTVWEKLGGLDEKYRNGAEDVDFFLKAMKEKCSFGYCFYEFVHQESKSTGRFDWGGENDRLFFKKWGNYLKDKKNMVRIKNRQIKTDENEKGQEIEVISECMINGKRYFKGDKVILTREQKERLRNAGCIA